MLQITDQAAKLNRKAWDSFRRQRDEGLVKIRNDSAADILAAKTRLPPEMLDFAGDVRGKRLLDMGCGDAPEMLEWALLGADVVGVDGSPKQLEAAQRNADKLRDAGKLKTSCRLILADLLRLPEDLLRGEFDIVFSGWVTCWIGDLDKWFRNVFLSLKPRGIFLLCAGHPISEVLAGRRKSYASEGPIIEEGSEPSSWNPAGDYITTYEWYHTLGSIVTAIGQSGLRITHLLEFVDAKGEDPYGEFILSAVKD